MDDWFVKKCPSVANLSHYKLIKNLVVGQKIQLSFKTGSFCPNRAFNKSLKLLTALSESFSR
jgi:hypothetical protein